MSRAAFTFKSREELARMGLAEVDAYIRTLQFRTAFLSGPSRKSTKKQLEVAIRLRNALSAAQRPGNA